MPGGTSQFWGAGDASRGQRAAQAAGRETPPSTTATVYVSPIQVFDDEHKVVLESFWLPNGVIVVDVSARRAHRTNIQRDSKHIYENLLWEYTQVKLEEVTPNQLRVWMGPRLSNLEKQVITALQALRFLYGIRIMR